MKTCHNYRTDPFTTQDDPRSVLNLLWGATATWNPLPATQARDRTWVNQEMRKGCYPSYINWFLLYPLDSTVQGGWASTKSGAWSFANPPDPDIHPVDRVGLQATPFFLNFRDQNLNGANGSAEATDPAVRAEVLATAIPALSFAMGANELTFYGESRNFDMMDLQTHGWPQVRTSGSYNNSWLHNDLKYVAYCFTRELHSTIVQIGELNK